MNNFSLPLMDDNINREDINSLVNFLTQDPIPKLTNGEKVRQFEQDWSKWLGTEYSLFVNSGASANELTMLALSYMYGSLEVIVPPLTWISDISSVLFAGHKLKFCDINFKNLSFDMEMLKRIITPNTKVIFVTHVLGINGITQELLDLCKEKNILLIEDVCESHGTTFNGKKLGSFGRVSNFSFYFAHHMSTVEGGMICTNDKLFYSVCRSLRSHGMLRECNDDHFKRVILAENPDLNPDFIFIHPSHNFRSTEMNAVLGISQLKRLDGNNEIRKQNFDYFIKNLSSERYMTDLEMAGQCNYAFIVILKDGTFEKRDLVEKTLKENGIEFRRGLSGGGNQMRQPFFKKNFKIPYEQYPNIDYIHNFSWYIGNYPTLKREKIDFLLNVLNNI